MADVELGLVEGYYGKPWSWAARRDVVETLAPHGYRFFLYAPKADPFLRRRWQEPHPVETASELQALSARCRELGVRFGVGLSPYEIYRDFGPQAQAALAAKLAQLDALGLDDLAILFDDMRGDLPGLAASQVDIVHWIAERTSAGRLIVCPSYYTDDSILDRVFGQRPENYLEDLGAGLDRSIEVFWTGEEVCSREFSPGHLERVGRQLRRKPLLWDNYPVNDGPMMSPFLHLRGFTGRPASIAPKIAAHAVNPALQPTLSKIPAITLAQSYRLGEAYEYVAAFQAAAREVLGEDLARAVERNLTQFQGFGLDRLTDENMSRMRPRYAGFDHPGAREIVAWLDGAYRITLAEIEAT
ncbi:beta-N-acetylglucosaminidase domain-containing protein [Phenylobacterium sp.]|uniref:beta-N-acetylglucosaminidase domain-containing protein n=1 Tax=Phenylobacterium sp. TaxID=1871053 RepID=UPI0028976353|nr:beta-N-acetylglucosaminidase domain-containing protein [Phenylobacterium sp.]